LQFASSRTLAESQSVWLADDFTSVQQDRWPEVGASQSWRIEGGVLSRVVGKDDALCPASVEHVVDSLIEARVRVAGEGRRVFGIATRVSGNDYLLVRYYDSAQQLELLTYQSGDWSQGERGIEKTDLQRNKWYRMKVATFDDQISAKLWPEDAAEPDWQLVTKVDRTAAGELAVVAHDDTRVELDWIRAHSDHPELASLRDQRVAEREAELVRLREQLQLAFVATSTPKKDGAGEHRVLHVVPFVENDRHPVGGKLVVATDEQEWTYEIDPSDYDQQMFRVEIPEPKAPQTVRVQFETELDKQLTAELKVEPYVRRSYRDYVRTCLDTLIEHGRDRYGEVSSPLFMAVVDADLLVSPSRPLTLDTLVWLEERLHRRAERGSNMWYDQGLLSSLRRMSELTDDPAYATAADDCVRHFFNNCYKSSGSRLPAWGTHIYWDCYRDRPAGDGDGHGPHEILVFNADWENMIRVHPQGTRRTIEGIWEYHIVDKETGLHNRHDDRSRGCDFAFSGGSFVKAFAAMFQATDDPQYLQRAKIVAGWHWNNRNTSTGLTADCPGLTSRYDGNHTFTTVSGPHATALLEAYRLTGDRYFRDVAISYIKSYDRYGWDEERQDYWAMMRLDGTPIPDQPKGSGYDAWAPYGPVDVWRSTVYSYEFSLSAAQAAIQAYETTVRDSSSDAELLKIAARWGSMVEKDLPPHAGRRWAEEVKQSMPRIEETSGTYAENYGRAISLFVHLYRATEDQRYLILAQELADEAIDKLYHNGLFLGHPAKPYYETTNGTGLLLLALLELDAPEEEIATAF